MARDIRRTGWLGAKPERPQTSPPPDWDGSGPDIPAGCGTDPGIKLAISLAVVGVTLSAASRALLVWRLF